MLKNISLLIICLVSFLSEAQTEIKIDVKKYSATLDPNALGICLSFPTDDDAYFPERTRSHAEALNELKVGTLRFPMGTLADNYMWTTPGTYGEKKLTPRVSSIEENKRLSHFIDAEGNFKETSLDFEEYMDLVKKTNTVPVIMVNAFGHLYKGSQYTYEEIKKNAVEWVRYANVTHDYNIKYWEIGNELSVAITKGYITRKKYVDLFNDFAKAMKEIDPTIKTGLGVGFNYYDVIEKTAEFADFIIPHQYQHSAHNYEEYKNLDDVNTKSINAANKAIEKLPKKYRDKMEILVTEFNSTIPGNGSWDLPGVKVDQSNSLVKSLYTFELLQEAFKKYDRIKYMHFWVTHSPWNDYGHNRNNSNAFDEKLNTLAQGEILKLFNTYKQEKVLEGKSKYGKIRFYAHYTPKTKKLVLFILNKDSKTVDVDIDLNNYRGNQKNSGELFRGTTNNPNDISPVVEKCENVVVKNDHLHLTLLPVSIRVVEF